MIVRFLKAVEVRSVVLQAKWRRRAIMSDDVGSFGEGPDWHLSSAYC